VLIADGANAVSVQDRLVASLPPPGYNAVAFADPVQGAHRVTAGRVPRAAAPGVVAHAAFARLPRAFRYLGRGRYRAVDGLESRLRAVGDVGIPVHRDRRGRVEAGRLAGRLCVRQDAISAANLLRIVGRGGAAVDRTGSARAHVTAAPVSVGAAGQGNAAKPYLTPLACRAERNSSPGRQLGSLSELATSSPISKPNRAICSIPAKSQSSRYSSEGW